VSLWRLDIVRALLGEIRRGTEAVPLHQLFNALSDEDFGIARSRFRPPVCRATWPQA
jgi:hypothetical protein